MPKMKMNVKNEGPLKKADEHISAILEKGGIQLEPFDKGILVGIHYGRQLEKNPEVLGAAGLMEAIILVSILKNAAESIAQ
jgi:hypothetical protein